MTLAQNKTDKNPNQIHLSTMLMALEGAVNNNSHKRYIIELFGTPSHISISHIIYKIENQIVTIKIAYCRVIGYGTQSIKHG